MGRTGDGYRYDHAHVSGPLAGCLADCRYVHEPRTDEDRLTDHSALTVALALNAGAPLDVTDLADQLIRAGAVLTLLQNPPAEDGMKVDTWDYVTRLRKWLDADAAPTSVEDARLLRVLKISEELGEVAEALHGALGANPRKGASHDWGDVAKELADVIVTVMVAWTP
ncbi:MazG-like family protein [Streptomyces sp. DT2A-34]|uniref:MazG-like family protein n=1 Tax=Streptomyces sp. DT2A-34 TaxID=3051182 RepID=UPI00265C342D|nr:MazG-like family protein [Streptomyces sp. DT2A-34]MDO0916745.1 MazG-like family protein [Streptomyces sp. DT2A-34]